MAEISKASAKIITISVNIVPNAFLAPILYFSTIKVDTYFNPCSQNAARKTSIFIKFWFFGQSSIDIAIDESHFD